MEYHTTRARVCASWERDADQIMDKMREAETVEDGRSHDAG